MKYEFRFEDDSIKVTQNINYKFLFQYIKNSIKITYTTVKLGQLLRHELKNSYKVEEAQTI